MEKPWWDESPRMISSRNIVKMMRAERSRRDRVIDWIDERIAKCVALLEREHTTAAILPNEQNS